MSRVIIAILLTTSAWAQDRSGRYMVFFKQKLGPTTSYSVDKPAEFLSEKSISRRRNQNIAIKEEDFPVSPDYIAELIALNIPVYYTLRWVNGALVETEGEQLNSIRALSSVSRVEYVAPPSEASGEEPTITGVPAPDPDDKGLLNREQLAIIGLDDMHADGIKGEGVDIAVLDSGFPGVNVTAPFRHLILNDRIKDTYDFVGHSSNVFLRYFHGTEVLSVMATDLPNVYVGGAPRANYYLYVTEEIATEYRVEEYNWMAAAERADSTGVDIIASSLGYYRFDDTTMNYKKAQIDGQTAVISQAAAKALSKGIIVVVAAGNFQDNDWQLITPPSDVKGVIGVGSVNIMLQHSSFSLSGPTADGRIKPDVSTLGENVAIFSMNGTLNRLRGTSYAAPAIACLVAGLIQIFPTYTPAQIYKQITLSGSKSTSPDTLIGYGIPDYTLARRLGDPTAISPLAEEKEAPSLVMYPNPLVGNYVEIQLNNAALRDTGEPVELSIYDASGRRVMAVKKRVTPAVKTIRHDVATLSPGLYLVKIQNGANIQTVRLIKH